MKIKTLVIYLFLLGAGFSINLNAAVNHCCKNEEWKQRMMSEKIAFLTSEMNITPAEAQVFWPVYNQIWKEKDQAMMNIFKTYRDLEEAIKANKGTKEIESLLDKYLNAKEKQRNIDSEADERFKEVLSIEKIAKLYIGEERFRRQQIHKLHEKREEKTAQ